MTTGLRTDAGNRRSSQSIVYKLPASLISTVLYNVTLDGTDTTKPKTITREAAEPLRLSFVNTYDQSVTPETGDDISIGLFIGLMATSTIGLAVLLLAKKKKLIAE